MLLFRVLCVLFAFVYQIDSSVEGLFPDRSGDIIISEPVHVSVQSSWKVSDIEVKDVQVYNMLARVLGAPRVRLPEANDAPVTDLFAPQKHAFIFAMEGLSPEQLPSDLKLLGKSKATAISSSTSPATPFSVIASALTGSSVPTHGVVNKGWPSYDASKDDFYVTTNLYDRILQVQKENSLSNEGMILSASYSAVGARLVSPHADLVSGNDRSFFWDKKNSRFTSLFGTTSPFAFGRESFEKLFIKINNDLSGVYTTKTGNAIYYKQTGTAKFRTIDNEETFVTFDLSDESDEAFITELLFLVNAGSIISSTGIPPKVFSFHFESLLKLAEKYGPSSQQYRTALYLLDAAVSYVSNIHTTKTQKAFDEFAIFYIPNAHNLAVSDIVKKVQKKIDSVASFLVSKLPHIYFDSNSNTYDHAKATSLCEHLKASLNKQVVCHSDIKSIKRTAEFVTATAPTPTVTAGPTVNPAVGRMHIILWSVIVIFTILASTLCCLLSVHGQAEQDSTLYGQTRTIFEKPLNKKKHH